MKAKRLREQMEAMNKKFAESKLPIPELKKKDLLSEGLNIDPTISSSKGTTRVVTGPRQLVTINGKQYVAHSPSEHDSLNRLAIMYEVEPALIRAVNNLVTDKIFQR
jgi:hypothetical protein